MGLHISHLDSRAYPIIPGTDRIVGIMASTQDLQQLAAEAWPLDPLQPGRLALLAQESVFAMHAAAS